MWSPNLDRVFGSLAFKTPWPIEINTCFEITAPDNLTPMTTSSIFGTNHLFQD